MSVQVKYENVLEAYRTVNDIYPMEGDILSHSNGKLAKADRSALNRDDEALVSLLQGINETAKTVFEGIDGGELTLTEGERAEFLKLRYLFALKLEDLAPICSSSRGTSKLGAAFTESAAVHKPKFYRITSNDVIDFSKTAKLAGRTIPLERDQGESLNVIRTRISEAKAHLLPRANYIAKTVGRVFLHALLGISLVPASAVLKTALSGLKSLGVLQSTPSVEYSDAVISLYDRLFPGLKEHAMARKALAGYALQLEREPVWDDARFELFESVAQFLWTGPSLMLTELTLDKDAFLNLRLSDDANVNALVAEVIEQADDAVYGLDAMTVVEEASSFLAGAEPSASRQKFIEWEVSKLNRESEQRRSYWPLLSLLIKRVMTPEQVVRYMQIYKDHTSFRRVRLMGYLLPKNGSRPYAKPTNNLTRKIKAMGFSIL